jgi:hypothetical protein
MLIENMFFLQRNQTALALLYHFALLECHLFSIIVNYLDALLIIKKERERTWRNSIN